MPADALIAHTIRRELEAIIDRREWEPAEPPAAAVAVDTTPSDRAA